MKVCTVLRSFRLETSASSEILEAIIATQSSPASVIETLTASLLKNAINADDDNNVTITTRRLLAQVRQRQPQLLENAVESCAQEDESLKDALEQLIISLSTVRLHTYCYRIVLIRTLV